MLLLNDFILIDVIQFDLSSDGMPLIPFNFDDGALYVVATVNTLHVIVYIIPTMAIMLFIGNHITCTLTIVHNPS